MFTDIEKIRLISGRSFWSFGLDGADDLPVMKTSDGPCGLRQQYRDEGYDSRPGSRPSVCYPSAAALAASFDTGLVEKIGRALGSDCRENGVSVLLGPAMNIKRNPLCGRNFEYYSEDPVLSGLMAAAFVKGVQKTGTCACIKHFAANSQETRRARSNSVIDPATLFEIYLKGFQIVVEEAEPAMVMLAYNRLNGIYCCENEWLIRDILRGEFGFKGACVSDWGAVNRICSSINAGLDLRMPGGVEGDEEYLLSSLRSGKLKKEALDRAAEKLESITRSHVKACAKKLKYDRAKNIRTAEKAAKSSIVLLKNDGAMPLARNRKVLVVGEMAKFPKYRGGGSGSVKLSHAVTPWTALKKHYADISYCRGYDAFGNTEASEIMINDACKAAGTADSVVVFAGLPEAFETEGLDRRDLDLPFDQNELIERLSEVNPEISVVVSAGSAVLMPWADKVRCIFMCYPLGSCTGDAVCEVISGRENPSGRLPETFPLKMHDLPSSGYFPARGEDAVYSEGRYFGYRYFNTRDKDVAYPFGHGLSYTEFRYSDFSAELEEDEIRLRVNIENTGKRTGSEVAQFYIAHESEPDYKELLTFVKIKLKQGETGTADIRVSLKSLAAYDITDNSMTVRKGEYSIWAASSSRDLRECASIIIKDEIKKLFKEPFPEAPDLKDKRRFTRNTSLSELEEYRLFRPAAGILKKYLSGIETGFMSGEDMYAVLADSPLRQLPMGTNGRVRAAQVKKATDIMEKLLHKKNR